MPIATIEKLASKIPGLKLINAYGSTETTSPSTIMPPELTAAISTASDCPVRARRSRGGCRGPELPRGEIGEIWIHGGSVIKGYWNNPKATAENFTAGFWHSGDLGSIDAENFVRVFDRQKDMINRGGLKIYSAEVELVLAGHRRRGRERDHRKTVPGAGRARSCRDRDPRRRHRRSVARLVRRAAVGLQGAGDHGLISEPLPRNANGKVMKRQLREALAGASKYIRRDQSRVIASPRSAHAPQRQKYLLQKS